MTDNYSQTIVVNNNAKEAYEAILKGIQHWWTINIDYVDTDQTFTVKFGSSYKTFRVIEWEQDKRICWLCEAALIDHQNLHTKDEWVGTEIVWLIEKQGKSSVISMTHKGLTADLECFSICQEGWDYFFLESLSSYLDMGVGKPFDDG